MDITIVSGFFIPEITPRSFRTAELVKELVREGHRVTLFIPYREYDYSEFQKEFPINIQYFSDYPIKTLPLPKGRSVFKRAYRMFAYFFISYTEYPVIKYVSLIPKCLAHHSTDLLISIAAPHAIHWGVAKAFQRNPAIAKKWIADCGDPYMGDQTRSHFFYFNKYEHLFCSQADFITVPIPQAIKAYYPEYRDKIVVNPQGFDFTKEYRKTQLNPVPTFAYAGILYKGYRDLNSFVNMLNTKFFNTDFKFILYTPENAMTQNYKAILGDKLEVRGLIPRDELLPIMTNMDFLINIENKGKVQSPSKLIDYALSQRPILSVGDDTPAQKVLKFFEGDYTSRLVLPDMSQYDIRNVCKKFLSI